MVTTAARPRIADLLTLAEAAAQLRVSRRFPYIHVVPEVKRVKHGARHRMDRGSLPARVAPPTTGGEA